LTGTFFENNITFLSYFVPFSPAYKKRTIRLVCIFIPHFVFCLRFKNFFHELFEAKTEKSGRKPEKIFSSLFRVVPGTFLLSAINAFCDFAQEKSGTFPFRF